MALWGLALVVEALVVVATHREFLAGSWEVTKLRNFVVPLTFGLVAPLAVVAAVIARGALTLGRTVGRGSRALRVAFEVLGGVAGCGAGVALSTGRRMASWALRGPFVVTFALVGVVAAAWVFPRVVTRVARTPNLGFVGLAATVGAWWLDLHVLPRLYPAFHLGLEILLLGSLAGAAIPVAARLQKGPRWWDAAGGLLVAGFVATAAALPLARGLRDADNLRWILVESAPLLGRGVIVAEHLAPPDDDGAHGDVEGPALTGSTAARSLDWTGRDIILVTVDALRPDHMGLYGYGRPTTPNLDAWANEGSVFDAAYAAVPHTSYSITSMMTGKHMRGLASLGKGADSETWAQTMRRYGYRTAAFFPPAVFYIDSERLGGFQTRAFDFEYVKDEFASFPQRVRQVDDYLAGVPAETPVFLWVHAFEPHEPYEHHYGISFVAPGDKEAPVDRYDGEIAATDIGFRKLLHVLRTRRPRAVVLMTADHGEEFGDHGGSHHGTTVYEEQVRVPLVIVGPGVVRGHVVANVQSVDLYPTVLSALGIPVSPRVHGRDLGPLLSNREPRDSPGGLAFAEADKYLLLAQGRERLVCRRDVAACALYDVSEDPHELRDLGSQRPASVARLKALRGRLLRDLLRFEPGTGSAVDLPEPLVRALQGEAAVAEDVAPLLDDADGRVRALAAEALFHLKSSTSQAALRRAATSDDETVRRFAVLTLARLGPGGVSSLGAVEQLLHDPDVAWRRRAALTFGELGDRRGEGELLAWWRSEGPLTVSLSFEDARALIRVFKKFETPAAVPLLTEALHLPRLRKLAAEALAAYASPTARAGILRVMNAQPDLEVLRILATKGLHDELFEPLQLAMAHDPPQWQALTMAQEMGFLTSAHHGALVEPGARRAQLALPVGALPSRGPGPGNLALRLFAKARSGSPPLDLHINGAPVQRVAGGQGVGAYGLPAEILRGPTLTVEGGTGAGASRDVLGDRVEALWLVVSAPGSPVPDGGRPFGDGASL